MEEAPAPAVGREARSIAFRVGVLDRRSMMVTSLERATMWYPQQFWCPHFFFSTAAMKVVPRMLLARTFLVIVVEVDEFLTHKKAPLEQPEKRGTKRQRGKRDVNDWKVADGRK